MSVKEKQNFSSKQSYVILVWHSMKQQWHPVVYFHKQVSYPTFTNFWLTSEFFFFFATGFQGTFPPFPPNRHYQNSYHTPSHQYQ